MSDRQIFAHKGSDAHEVLRYLHNYLRPKSYIEIGTWRGESLALASCASIAIDPKFDISTNVIGVKPLCALYQMDSDDFFASHDPTRILGRRIDLAFLDGLHLFESLLRDFINTEKFSNRNSVIALHDCLPPDPDWAHRSKPPGEPWTGDVWKVPLILKKYRPDLKIHLLNSFPTGLILITNLDRKASLLSKQYFNIVEEFSDLDLLEFGKNELQSSFRIMDTSAIDSPAKMSQLFWL